MEEEQRRKLKCGSGISSNTSCAYIGKNRVAQTSTLPPPKNKGEAGRGEDIYRHLFSPGWCLELGLKTDLLVPVGDMNRD